MDQSLKDVLSAEELQDLCRDGQKEIYDTDEVIFEESMDSDKLYIVDSGAVSITIRKYLDTEEISRLSTGQILGEMGVLDNVPRTASARAVAPTELISVGKDAFRSFMARCPVAARKVTMIVEARNAELALKECVIGNTDLGAGHFHISMKGDPSLRETVFSRERYYSIVDEVVERLEPILEDMLINRNVFRFVIYFNSGEIRIYTVFDPFTPQIHAANRLVSSSYVDRHFPMMDWDEKTRLIGELFQLIAGDKYTRDLSDYWRSLFLDTHTTWRPVPAEHIRKTISQIKTLRNLEQYYLRNISISMVRDVIRIEFNCDGTHIVNSDDYQRFIRENLI